MIVTVTPNAVLDICYEVDRIVEGDTHFVRRMWSRAGGKGVNVTSVLTTMGYPSIAAGFAGGPQGQTILADLSDRGVPHLFTDVREASRRIVTVQTRDGVLTRFAEPGPTVPSAAWEQLRATLEPLILGPATTLVVSGRMPEGPAYSACDLLLDAAHQHGVPSVVDASGEALLAALSAHPDVVKPKREELAEATGVDGVVAGARDLQRRGARTVLVTLAEHDALLVPPDGPMLLARLPRPEKGSALGAGDAVAAAVATGLTREPWEILLRRAVAWAGAALRSAVPGDIDPDDVAELEPTVVVEEFTGVELTPA